MTAPKHLRPHVPASVAEALDKISELNTNTPGEVIEYLDQLFNANEDLAWGAVLAYLDLQRDILVDAEIAPSEGLNDALAHLMSLDDDNPWIWDAVLDIVEEQEAQVLDLFSGYMTDEPENDEVAPAVESYIENQEAIIESQVRQLKVLVDLVTSQQETIATLEDKIEALDEYTVATENYALSLELEKDLILAEHRQHLNDMAAWFPQEQN